jgi:hypothetical protein
VLELEGDRVAESLVAGGDVLGLEVGEVASAQPRSLREAFLVAAGEERAVARELGDGLPWAGHARIVRAVLDETPPESA